MSTISVTAVDEYDRPGTGSVSLTSTAGSLKTAQMLTLDVNGYAETPFHCETATDMDCMGAIQVKGVWARPGKEDVIGYGHVNVGATGGGGGGSGAGGGAGGGGFGSTKQCMVGQTPGLQATCCENLFINPPVPGPLCIAKGVTNGEVIMQPFQSMDGGPDLMLPLVFTVGTGFADINACNAQVSGFVVDLSAYDAGTGQLAAICGEGVVKTNGSWQVYVSGVGCSSMVTNTLGECLAMFPSAGADGGAVGDYHVMIPNYDNVNGVDINGNHYVALEGMNKYGFYWVDPK